MSVTITDWREQPIRLFDRVLYGEPLRGEFQRAVCTVVAISDPDADYDDELQRGVEYPPRVTVVFSSGERDEVSTFNVTRPTWADYPDGPDEWTYQADDLELL